MKKITIILAVLAASFAVSCTKEAPEAQLPQDQNAPAGMKQVTITASIDGADTKTSYDADGKFSWTKGDQISVLTNPEKVFYTFTAEQDGPTSTFVGYIPEGAEIRKEAFFPASDGHYREGDYYFFNIVGEKDMSAVLSADIPMGSYVAPGEYTFKHLTAALKFTFTNFPAEVKSAKISFENESMKFSGTFSIAYSSSSENWHWWPVESGVENDADRIYSRTVPVMNQVAEFYVPYNGKLWGGYDNLINVIGYDESGNEFVLLKDKLMPGGDLDMQTKGKVYPVKALELPTYTPPVDWNKVDWTAENVVSIAAEKISAVKVLADKYYLYVQVASPISNEWDRLYYGIAKGTGDQKPWWQWNTSAEIAYYDNGTVVDNVLSVNYNGYSADTYFTVDDETIYWYIAFPRAAHELTKSSGQIYFGVMTYLGSNTHTGTAPLRNNNMAEITLP